MTTEDWVKLHTQLIKNRNDAEAVLISAAREVQHERRRLNDLLDRERELISTVTAKRRSFSKASERHQDLQKIYQKAKSSVLDHRSLKPETKNAE